jgi:integrase
MPVRKDARGRWHVEVCYRRQRVHRVCPRDTAKAQAQQLEAQIRKDLFLARAGSSNSLIADALAHYAKHYIIHHRDQASSLGHVNRLAEWVDGRRLSEAAAAAESFKAEAREHYSAATINRSLAALRRACHIAYDLGWVSDPVYLKVRGLPEHNQRHVYLTKPQLAKLLSHCPDQETADAILIAVYTGLRLGELMRLTQDNLRDGMIRLDARTKTGRPRAVPILPVIRKALKCVPFSHSKREIQRRFNVARKAAKMPHVRFHDLRHTTASLLVQAGVPLYTVGEILGHASTQTTARYSHLNDKVKRAAMRKIG